MSDVTTRLREESERLSGSSLTNGCPGCGIAANVAEEAADEIDRLRQALALARNRLQRAVVDHPTGTEPFYRLSEWADEASRALTDE